MSIFLLKNKLFYYMARYIRAFSLVLSWSGFYHTDRFRGNGVFFSVFLSKAGKFICSLNYVKYPIPSNKRRR